MWTPKSACTVAIAARAPPYEYAQSIFPVPPVASGAHRSRGIDSIVTCLVEGTTRTRIIDWVSTRSPENFESSSEPRRRTVKAPEVATVGAELALGVGLKRIEVGDGDGRSIEAPEALKAIMAAGRKYARL